MQTEAAPREPFTIGVLFRYKLTIFAVAVFVILGGYVRIVTQPKLYEATARLAVRFTSDAIALGGVERDNFFRLPLLEEEVKAYQSQLTDRPFIAQVLVSLPPDVGQQPPDPGADDDSAAQRFRAAFLSAYYSIRQAVFAAVDAVLFTKDYVVTAEEQRVMQIISRLKVEAGTEASHVITVGYQNSNAAMAAQLVNTLAKRFIETQKRKVKRKDEAKAQQEVDEAMRALVENRRQLFEISNKLGSPTMEDGIRAKYQKLETLLAQKRKYEVGRDLLATGVVPFDRDLSLETQSLGVELEASYFEVRMRYEQLAWERPDEPKYSKYLTDTAQTHMDERRKRAIERDKIVVESHIKSLADQIKQLEDDPLLASLTADYTRLFLAQNFYQARVVRAETELNEVRAFNKELEDENVSENIALWQPAQVPPFPVPQHREVKLLVVIALGFFAGCAAALVRHQVRPKPLRRAIPRTEEEADVPIVILPDDGREDLEKDLELDISFPAEDGAEEAKGKEARR